MEARSRPVRWTWAEFARLPSEGGTRHEVVAGEPVVSPAPSLRHQRVVGDLADRARKPEVRGPTDHLRWQPRPDDAALEFVVGEVLGE